MAILARSPKTRTFLKKCKGGTKTNLSKIAQKVALVWKAQKHSGANNIILYLVCTWSAKTAKDFGAESGSKSARMAKLWQLWQGHPKVPFSEKVQRGDQGNFFKNRWKSGPPFKNPKALWRKRHYPLIIQLSNYRKVTQNPHFLEKCKGGTKGNFSKIA